jgi:oleate hydratase
VDFHFDTKITDILTSTEDGQETVSQLGIIENGFPMRKTVGQHDLVIITLGSTVSGSATGTNDSPPGWHSFEPGQELDENWSLWLDIGTRDPRFGNPYNFCTRESESMLESFTITTKDQGLFNYLNSLAQSMTEAGVFIALQESPWRLSVCIPTQPVFSHQPNDVRVLWGFALSPECKGDYVKKPMFRCSGAEVTTELLAHLNFSSSSLQRTMTIPRVMPRMSSLLLARSLGDRPQVIPHNTLNVGLVGQFVEIPQYSSVDTSYGVRAAQVAVSQLMGLHTQKFEERGPSISTLLNILFRK